MSDPRRRREPTPEERRAFQAAERDRELLLANTRPPTARQRAARRGWRVIDNHHKEHSR